MIWWGYTGQQPMDENLKEILEKIREMEKEQIKEQAWGDKKDNHNGDSNLEREQ